METNEIIYEMKLTRLEIVQTLVALESHVIFWEKKGIEMDFTKQLVMKFLKAEEEINNSPF